MNTDHLTEEQLTLHYYGEADEADVEQHLNTCEACRASYRVLQSVLNSVQSFRVPERPADYGHRVWTSLDGRLATKTPSVRITGFAWPGPKMWLAAAAAVVLVAGAFIAGRMWNGRGRDHATVQQGRTAANLEDDVRERVLLVAVRDHLERSQMVLIEVANATPQAGGLDISYQQQSAEDLLDSNRLYRQTAANVGDAASAAMLEDLERVLIEIAHSPQSISPVELQDLRRQIEDQGLLFKVKVFGSRIQNDLSDESGDRKPSGGSQSNGGANQANRSSRSKS